MQRFSEFTSLLVCMLAPYLAIASPCYADDSYIHYSNQPGSTYIGSVPYAAPSFYYIGPGGNAIGYREIHSMPIFIHTQYPYGNWVWMKNGSVPFNALVYQYHNGRPLFYCRTFYFNQLVYGYLVPNEGCYLSPGNAPMNEYEVLIR